MEYKTDLRMPWNLVIIIMRICDRPMRREVGGEGGMQKRKN